MAKSKKMQESGYSKLVKEANAVGELIRTLQDEKQAVIDDFDKEKKRYQTGKISRTTLQSSAKKSNNELTKLDKKIRTAITRVSVLSSKIREFATKQSPKVIRVKAVSGGRKKSSDTIDPSVGFYFEKFIGDAVKKDETIATLYSRDAKSADKAIALLMGAITITNESTQKPKLIHSRI